MRIALPGHRLRRNAACGRCDSHWGADPATSFLSVAGVVFSEFVSDFGGHDRLLRSVSAGDVFGELIHQDWYAEWTVPQPGRLQHWYRGDVDFPEFIARVDGLPLTVTAVRQLVQRLARALQANYRVILGQSAAKRNHDSHLRQESAQ